MAMRIQIKNESDAWELLERATSGELFPDDVQLDFVGWPVFQMGVQGKDWDCTVPTRVMSPLLDVQKDINRAYANVRYGATNLRKLQDEERDDLEVVIKVKKGSSLFDAELWKQLSFIAQAAVGRMNGTEIVVTVLGLGLLFTAPVCMRDQIQTCAVASNTPVTRIGQITAQQPIQVMKDAEAIPLPSQLGFDHFTS
jgi:hypothetical protein